MGKLIQKTVYFREEDVAAWEAIDNKAEWLHQHLQPFVGTDPILVPPVAKKIPKESTGKDFCPEGHSSPRQNGKCMVKGCKYAK